MSVIKKNARRADLETPHAKLLKRKRTISKRKKIFFFFLIFILLVIGVSYLSKVPAINISEIEVNGNSVTSTEDVIESVNTIMAGNYLHLFSRRNSLIYPKNVIQKGLLEKFKRFQTADIELVSTRKLLVTVSERNGHYLWCGRELSELTGESLNPDCYYLDDSGYIFSRSPYFSGNVFIKFFGKGELASDSDPSGRQFVDEVLFIKISKLLEGLQTIGIYPYAISLSENMDFNVYISPIGGGNRIFTKIMFNAKNDLEKSIENLNAALLTDPLKTDFKKRFSELEYIDLRFNNKVFYKFK